MESSEKSSQLFFNGDATFAASSALPDLKRIASKWSLAGDAQLLGYMQHFSSKLILQSQDIHKQLDNLMHSTKVMDVKLNNVFNDLNTLANTQFVENRVYDEDPCAVQPAVEDKTKVPESNNRGMEEEMMRIMSETVALCRKAVVQNAASVEKDRYASRRLPELLNSRQPAPSHSNSKPPPLEKPADIDSSGRLPAADATSQTSNPGDMKPPASGSKAMAGMASKSSPRDLFSSAGVNSDDDDDEDDDLFSRPTKVPKQNFAADDIGRFASSPAAGVDQEKRESSPSFLSSSAASEDAQKVKKKIKSLFDESESDEDEDIFKQIANIVDKKPANSKLKTVERKKSEEGGDLQSFRKVPMGGVSVFGDAFHLHDPDVRPQNQMFHNSDRDLPPDSSLVPTSKSQSVEVKKPISLFDDDDDELFSSSKKSSTVKRPEPAPNRPPTKRDSSSESPPKSLPPANKIPVPVKSLFDDDDDDDDEEDDDIFSKLAKQNIATAEVKVSPAKVKEEVKILPKMLTVAAAGADGEERKSAKSIKSIFDDDAEDVRKVLPADKEAQVARNPAVKIKSIFDDDDEEEDDGGGLFGFANRPAASADGAEAPGKFMADSRDLKSKQNSADTFDDVPPVDRNKSSVVESSLSGRNLIEPIGAVDGMREKSLFDDDDEDEDDDDLFARLLKKEPITQKKSLNAGTVAERALETRKTFEEEGQTEVPVEVSGVVPTSSGKVEGECRGIEHVPRVKGGRISELQTALNINPSNLGPFSQKKFQKVKEEGLFDESIDERSATGKDANEKKATVDGAPASEVGDLELDRSAVLHCVAKDRPRLCGRRRPASRPDGRADAADLDRSNASVDVFSDSTRGRAPAVVPENPHGATEESFEPRSIDFSDVGVPPTEPPNVGADAAKECDPSGSIPGIDENLFGFPSTPRRERKTAKDPEEHSSRDKTNVHVVSQSDVRDFFGVRVGETSNPPSSKFGKSNMFEPPPLFSDDDDEDDDDEDLFGSSSASKISKPVPKAPEEEKFSVGEPEVDAEKSKRVDTERLDFFAPDDYDGDVEDIFSTKNSTSRARRDELLVQENVVAAPTSLSKPMFEDDDDDDDDDDLFSDVNFLKKGFTTPGKPAQDVLNNNVPEKEETSGIFGKDSNVAGKISDDDDDDLFSEKFVQKPAKIFKGPSKAVTKHSNIFGDHDDDIFSSSTARVFSPSSRIDSKSSASKPKPEKSSSLFEDPLNAL